MLKLQNILVTTDLSENAQAALPLAISLARQHSAKLHLLYVEEPNVILPVDDSMTLPQVEWLITARKEREQSFSKQAEELSAREGLQVVPHLHEGAPAKMILETARAISADCIVMCSHGRSGMARVLFGSVTESVLRSSPCPVLCLKHSGNAAAIRSNPVLVTTDLSRESLDAMPFAISLAAELGAKLHVLLALEDSLEIADDLVHPQVEWLVSEHQEMEKKLQALTLQLRDVYGIDIAPHLLHGKPAEAIVTLAGELNAGCIVMASHGRSGLKRLLVGSVAEEVIRDSPCPVLAIRNGTTQPFPPVIERKNESGSSKAIDCACC